MNQLWNRAGEVLNKQGRSPVREARCSAIVPRGFRPTGLPGLVLGRYWRKASEEEHQEFVKLFEITSCSYIRLRFANFGGETIKIRGSRSDATGLSSRLTSTSPGSASPLRIDWRLVTDNGGYKITMSSSRVSA